MKIALSPCSNDTFLFAGWLTNRIQSQLLLEPDFYDIETLNRYALQESYPLVKVSAGCFAKVQENYILLHAGFAQSSKGGPKVVSKGKQNISTMIIGTPGELSSAHLLFSHFCKNPAKMISMPYNTIVEAILSDKIDGGILIHEERFTFLEHELIELYDLGELFTTKFHLPVPLGVFALHKKYAHLQNSIETCIKESFSWAQKNRQQAVQFAANVHNQPFDLLEKHIDFFVSEDSPEKIFSGLEAIKILLNPAFSR